jgi:hypothetical protein
MQLYMIQLKMLSNEGFDEVKIYDDKDFYDEKMAELAAQGFVEVNDDEDGSPTGIYTIGGLQLYDSEESGEEWFYYCGPVLLETREVQAIRDNALAAILAKANL